MKNCPKCGAAVDENSKFCTRCGYNLYEANGNIPPLPQGNIGKSAQQGYPGYQQTGYQAPFQPEEPKKTQNTVIIALICTTIAIVVAATAYIIVNNMNKDSEIVRETIVAVAAEEESIAAVPAEEVAVEEEVSRPLTIASATCAQHLPPSSYGTYVAPNIIDGNPATIWAVSLDNAVYDCDALAGPVLRLNSRRIDEVSIRNGYQRDRDAFYNNSRASHIFICRGDDFEGAEQEDIIYDGPLEDRMGVQTFKVNPRYDNSRPTRVISIVFDAADTYYHGRKWNDLCISEISFRGVE